MRKHLHISLTLLGLCAVFAACERTPLDEGASAPLELSLQLAVRPFGADGGIVTKGEFEDPVPANIHYDYEKTISSLKLFVFDATDAFEDLDSDGKLDFNPSRATRIGAETPLTPLHVEDMGADGYRVDFRVEKPCEALAVVAIANMPDDVDASDWDTMADVDSDVYMEYTTSQETYHSNGIPMHGFQIFGSQVGNPSPQESSKLKYYKGISTKLPGTLSMQYALVRMQLRYLPAAGQLPASQVEISAKLTGYKSKFRLFPKEWLTGTLVTPFDVMVDGGDFVNGDISFQKVSYEVSATETADALVAYVPEMSAKVLADKMAADPTFKEPCLTAVMKKYEVDENNERTDVWTQFTYSADGVTMEDSASSPATVTYTNPAWTAWLQMRTLYARKDKAGNDVAVGTLFNLVRHYSYEWKATGIDK